MTPQDVYNYFGSLYKFREKTKMSCSSLKNWMKWGYVPVLSQHKLEHLTGGLLKAKIDETIYQGIPKNKVMPSITKKMVVTEDVLFITAFILQFLLAYKPKDESEKEKINWMINALTSVIYEGGDMPKLFK